MGPGLSARKGGLVQRLRGAGQLRWEEWGAASAMIDSCAIHRSHQPTPRNPFPVVQAESSRKSERWLQPGTASCPFPTTPTVR